LPDSLIRAVPMDILDRPLEVCGDVSEHREHARSGSSISVKTAVQS
jgi:hypothetical protein